MEAYPNIGHSLDELLLRERFQAPIHDGLVELRLRLDVLCPDSYNLPHTFSHLTIA